MLIITGRKNCGKTTLMEKLIAGMKQRELAVGVVKHDFHGTFVWEEPGKDTDRFWRSGADMVSIVGPGKYACKYRTGGELPLADLIRRYCRDMDVVLVEGFREEPYPKVEVVRSEISPESLNPEGLIAIASDVEMESFKKVFSLDRVDELVIFLIEYFSLSTR